MEKIFEDYFTQFQADMVSVCMDYVEKRADVIYIYCVYERNVLASGFFIR